MNQQSPARVLKPRSGRKYKIQAWDDFVRTGPGTPMGNCCVDIGNRWRSPLHYPLAEQCPLELWAKI